MGEKEWTDRLNQTDRDRDHLPITSAPKRKQPSRRHSTSSYGGQPARVQEAYLGREKTEPLEKC